MNARLRYLKARSKGLTDQQAARKAGYTNKAPGDARQTWQRIEQARDRGMDPDRFRKEVELLERALAKTTDRLKTARQWLEAAELAKRWG